MRPLTSVAPGLSTRAWTLYETLITTGRLPGNAAATVENTSHPVRLRSYILAEGVLTALQ